MARTYSDVYLTNCNNKLYLHLDGASGINESVTNASYFRVRIKLEFTYPSNYPSGYASCTMNTNDHLQGMEITLGPQFTLDNNNDLKIEWDLAHNGITDDTDDMLGYDDGGAIYAPDATGGSVPVWSDSDCYENNWWRHGIRVDKEAGVKIVYFTSSDTIAPGEAWVGTNAISPTGGNRRSAGAVGIYNAPSGTAGRALISDDGSTYSGFSEYGVVSNPLQSMATTSGCTGDPHVTTFDGCKYTL